MHYKQCITKLCIMNYALSINPAPGHIPSHPRDGNAVRALCQATSHAAVRA